MQSNNNSQLDARTFSEIYKSMPVPIQRTIRDQLTRQMNISRMTVYNWANGSTIPPYDDVKKKVQQILSKNFNLSTNFLTLFPPRK